MLGGGPLGGQYLGRVDAIPGSIRFDAVSSSGYQASLSSFSWTHTCGTGANRGLVVAVAIFATGTVTALTYAGTPMAFVGAVSRGVYRIELWQLENPATGANTVAVTLSVSLTAIGSAVSYLGVDQNDMVEEDADANGIGGTPSASVTPANDLDWILNAISTADATVSPATGQGQIPRANNSGALGSGAISDLGPVSPPASTSMGWSAVGLTDSWAQILAVLRPVPAIADLSDSGTSTLTVSSTGSEATADTAKTTSTLSTTATLEATGDSGRSTTASITSGAGEATTDTGKTTTAISTTASEALNDTSVSWIGLPPPALYGTLGGAPLGSLYLGGDELPETPGPSAIVDAGASTLTLATATASEAPRDAGSSTLTLTTVKAAEAVADSGASTLTLITSELLEEETDSGVSTLTLATVTTGEAIRDTGRSSSTVTTSGQEATTDTTGVSWIEIPPADAVAMYGGGYYGQLYYGGDAQYERAGAEAIADNGTSAFTLAAGASSEDLGEAATGVSVLLLTDPCAVGVVDAAYGNFYGGGYYGGGGSQTCVAAGETVADSGTSTLALIASEAGAEEETDSGASTITLTTVGEGERLADTAVSMVTVTTAGLEDVGEGEPGVSLLTLVGPCATGETGYGRGYYGAGYYGGESPQPCAAAGEAIADTGASLFTFVMVEAEGERDTGQSTLTLIAAGSEALTDTGETPLTLVTSEGEAEGESGSSTLTLAGSGVEAIADHGTSGIGVGTVQGHAPTAGIGGSGFPRRDWLKLVPPTPTRDRGVTAIRLAGQGAGQVTGDSEDDELLLLLGWVA